MYKSPGWDGSVPEPALGRQPALEGPPPLQDVCPSQASDSGQLLADLSQAISCGEIIPYYQPIVDLRNATLAGFECLARWSHPRHGWILPLHFIPLAVDAGLIDAMSKVLLRQACQDMADWGPRRTLSFNLAPQQLLGPFPTECLAILTAAGIDPERLILEITEEKEITELGTSRAVVERLRRNGIAFALDDFGKGLSNLQRLRELRFDWLKIDRELIALGGDDGVSEVTRGVIAMARSLELAITAEGVETSGQAGELAALGCTHAQGFYFSAPVSAAVAASLARSPGPLLARVRRAAIEYAARPAIVRNAC